MTLMYSCTPFERRPMRWLSQQRRASRVPAAALARTPEWQYLTPCLRRQCKVLHQIATRAGDQLGVVELAHADNNHVRRRVVVRDLRRKLRRRPIRTVGVGHHDLAVAYWREEHQYCAATVLGVALPSGRPQLSLV
jgi:hypothetical protein